MNIYTNPSSGIIEFNTGAASGNALDSNMSGAARFTFENSGEVNLTSYASGDDRFTIDGSNGRLFAVDNETTGSLFSVNDAAGLPVADFNSDGTVVMGDYNSGDFVLTGNQIGIGTTTPASKLHVEGGVTSALDINANASTGYTLVAADQSKLITCTSLNPTTISIPANSSVAFPVGTEISVTQATTGQVTIGSGAGVAALTAADAEFTTRVQYSACVLMQTGSDGWLVIGDLTS